MLEKSQIDSVGSAPATESPLKSLNPAHMRKLMRDRDTTTGDISDLVAQMNDLISDTASIATSLGVLAFIAERLAIKNGIVTPEEIANVRVGD